jgi:hypothetical protein
MAGCFPLTSILSPKGRGSLYRWHSCVPTRSMNQALHSPPRCQKSLSITQIKIIMEIIESTITKIEYLTSRQLTSSAKGDLVKRNLNLSPVRTTATFCQPFRMSFKMKIKSRTRKAIFKPIKSSIMLPNSPSPLRSAQVKPNPLPKGRGDKPALYVILSVALHHLVRGVAKNLIFISLDSE